MKRNSVLFYRNFYESIKSIPQADQPAVYDAIFAFVFENKEPELTGIAKTVFNLIKPLIGTINQDVDNIYVRQDHLSITWDEMNKLIDEYGEEKAEEYVKKVLNYRKNGKYKSLYLTACNWLKRDKLQKERPTSKLSI
jgi:hypothetical protein